MNGRDGTEEQGGAPTGEGTGTTTGDTGTTTNAPVDEGSGEGDGVQVQVEGGQGSDDTNEGEEPPPVEAQADTDIDTSVDSAEANEGDPVEAADDEDDGTIILADEDETETRYTLRAEANIGGADYRALNPIGGGDTAYFLYAKGEGDKPDTYTGLDGDELDEIVAAFEQIFVAENAADELERTKVNVVVEPGAGEAATPG